MSPLRVALALLDRRSAALSTLLASLRVVERVALVAGAVYLSGQGLSGLALVFVGFALLLGARSLSRHALVAAVRVRVTGAFARALVSRASFSEAREEGDEIAVFEGHSAVESVLSEYLPFLLADLVAAVLLAPYLLSAPARLVAWGAAAALAGAAAAAFARPLLERTEARLWSSYVPVVEGLRAAFRARAELVAGGQARAFVERFGPVAEEWARVSEREGRRASLLGRAPVAFALLVGAAGLTLDPSARAALASMPAEAAAAAAATLPAYVGWVAGLGGLFRTAGIFAPMARLLARDSEALRPSRPALGPESSAELESSPIAWENVGFAYGPRRVLSGISLELGPGDLVGIAGPNGSGKSTLLRLGVGLLRPDEGRVSVAGRNLASLGPAELDALRRGIGYLPQSPYLSDEASVEEAIRLLAPGATEDAMLEALRAVGLEHRLRDRVGEGSLLGQRVGALSSGERQRLALARVLATGARVLLLDEPDQNLDAEGLRVLGRLLPELAGTRAVAFVAHDPALLSAAARVVRLGASGRLEGEGARRPARETAGEEVGA